MAKLTGNYQGDSESGEELVSIDVRATPDEFDRIGPLPSVHGPFWVGTRQTFHEQPDGTWAPDDPQPPYTHTIPPKREVVDRIAKRVEIEADQRLIDWMRAAS